MVDAVAVAVAVTVVDSAVDVVVTVADSAVDVVAVEDSAAVTVVDSAEDAEEAVTVVDSVADAADSAEDAVAVRAASALPSTKSPLAPFSIQNKKKVRNEGCFPDFSLCSFLPNFTFVLFFATLVGISDQSKTCLCALIRGY